MVGGAHGQAGHHVQQLVVVVEELDSALASILLPREVEMIALVATASSKLVTLQIVQVKALRKGGLVGHFKHYNFTLSGKL